MNNRGAYIWKRFTKKKNIETEVPLTAGSQTVDRIPIAGCPHPVVKSVSTKKPNMETQKFVWHKNMKHMQGIVITVVPIQMYALVM